VEQLRLAAVQEEQRVVPRRPTLALAPELKEVVVGLIAQALRHVHEVRGGGDDEPVR